MSNSLNLQEIDTEAASSLANFFIRGGQNIAFFGQSGIGKTEIATTAIKEIKLKGTYLNLSMLDRNDLFGYPNLFDGAETISFKSPYYLPKLKEGQKATQVLLLDEIDKAPSEIHAPLLEILQFKTVNGQKIDCAACILTGNLPEENNYSNAISTALLDRTSKYIIRFDLQKWLVWGRANNIHDLVLGFLTSHPEFACGKIDGTRFANPSPRGWTLASAALFRAKAAKLMDSETITQIIAGFVGYEAGLMFKTWFNYYRGFEPFIHSLIENGSCAIKFAELSPTEKMVFCITACHLTKNKFLQETKKEPRYEYIVRLCNFLTSNNVPLEMQVIGIANSFPMEMVVSPKYRLYNCREFFELSSSLSISK